MTPHPKVLIGGPTAAPYEYCLPEWAARVKELTYKNKTAVLVDNSETIPYHKTITEKYGITAVKDSEFIKDSRLRLPNSRNILRQMVLDEGYDYFLSLEQDVIPPVDMIERLLRHQKPIVSGVYYKLFDVRLMQKGKIVKTAKKMVPLLAGFSPDPKKVRYLPAEEVEEEKFFRIKFSGLGCVLIHRSVLEKIKFRADPAISAHDDVWFCTDAEEQGFEMYVDTSVKCKHMLSGKPSGLFADAHKNAT